jgi:hypothetical protein
MLPTSLGTQLNRSRDPALLMTSSILRFHTNDRFFMILEIERRVPKLFSSKQRNVGVRANSYFANSAKFYHKLAQCTKSTPRNGRSAVPANSQTVEPLLCNRMLDVNSVNFKSNPIVRRFQ